MSFVVADPPRGDPQRHERIFARSTAVHRQAKPRRHDAHHRKDSAVGVGRGPHRGLAFRRSRDKRSLITVTAARSGRSSSRVSVRPRAAGTRSTSNNVALVRVTVICSAWPIPVKFAGNGRYCASAANEREWSRQ